MKFLSLILVAMSVTTLACGSGRLTPVASSSRSGTTDDNKRLQTADWAQLPGEDHPIVGTFRYQDGRCTETYSYRSDGTETSTSGQERLENRFRISPQALPNGVYRYVVRVTETNGARDCWGNVTPAGNQVVRYLGFRDGFRSLWICWDEAGTDCFGPVWRVEATVAHE